jgi:1-pyrroline-5-carboxylate dehydrogenase
MVQPYKHEPFTDFTIEENRQAYLNGIKTVESYLGKDYPLVIGGEKITTEDKIVSYNPSNKDEIIGSVSKASRDLAEQTMQAAVEAFKTWKKVKAEVREDVLLKE